MTPSSEPRYPLISLQQVTMQFGPQRVLHAIDLEIQRGQTTAIIGESGCGKTVLLKLIIGLLRPTVGRVIFDGKVLVDLPERELTRQRLRFGFLFQGAALFDSLSVEDNVAFGLRAQGRRPETEVREMTRLEQASAFLAVLELRRAGELAIEQAAPFAPIRVTKAPQENTAQEERTAAWTVRSA